MGHDGGQPQGRLPPAQQTRVLTAGTVSEATISFIHSLISLVLSLPQIH